MILAAQNWCREFEKLGSMQSRGMAAHQSVPFFLLLVLETVVMHGYETIKAAVPHNKHLHTEIR